MAKPDRSNRAVFWQQMLNDYAQSGCSVKQFCKKRSISIPSFYQWKKKLSTSRATTNAIIPIKLIAAVPAACAPSRTVQIFTPSGFSIRIDSATQSDDLLRILRAIDDSFQGGPA